MVMFSLVYSHLKLRIVVMLHLNEPIVSTEGASPPPR